MNEDPVDALVATAPDGIDFDGLRVEERDGYTFETPADAASGLVTAALREVATGDPHVGNWYFWHAVAPQTDARWAFLRWLEGAEEQPVAERYDALDDGLATEWGQLRLTVSLDGPAGRRYELRHVDDAGTSADELDGYEDPLDARELAKHDDDGDYRPLKTAPRYRPSGGSRASPPRTSSRPSTRSTRRRSRTGTASARANWTSTTGARPSTARPASTASSEPGTAARVTNTSTGWPRPAVTTPSV